MKRMLAKPVYPLHPGEAIHRLTLNMTLLTLLLCFSIAALAQTPAPLDETALLARAAEQAARGQYDLAIAGYTRAICLNPHNAATFVSRASAYGRQGNYLPAIADCSTHSSWTRKIRLPAAWLAYAARGNTIRRLPIIRSHRAGSAKRGNVLLARVGLPAIRR